MLKKISGQARLPPQVKKLRKLQAVTTVSGAAFVTTELF
jgi:hypothetical protein